MDEYAGGLFAPPNDGQITHLNGYVHAEI